MHDTLQNIFSPNLLAIIVSIVIGLVYGLEREVDAPLQYRHLTGIRSMPLLAAMGCVITIIAQQTNFWLLSISIAGMFIFSILVYFTKDKSNSLEIKQEIILLLVFVTGVLAGLHLFREAMAITVMAIAILSFKEQFHYYLARVNKEELTAFVKFAILFILVLPFIPDTNYGPEGIINPSEIAWVVLIVSSLGFIGYVLMKFGKPEKGILLTAFLGGLFSSTAVTWVYSAKSKEQKLLVDLYACGILLACAVMFGRILFFSYVFSFLLFNQLLIPGVMMIALLLASIALIMWRKRKETATTSIPAGSPMELGNALVFGAIYTGILFMVFYADKFWGTTGLYVSGIISGFSDVDAITINMSKFAEKTQRLEAATFVVILASLSNNLVKLMISLVRGDVRLRMQVGIAIAMVFISGILYVLIKGF
ncbi:MAG: DUF4010 domain-containing protein [Cyclobacteriaceae bacterium]|nr:DUF4010 domain-containing protein [Cyclobacteriaceae bacterium]